MKEFSGTQDYGGSASFQPVTSVLQMFCCQCGLSPWLVSANDSVTQGLSKVQSSGSRRLPCSQTQLETDAGVFEARFNMDFGEYKMYSAIWTA